MSYKNSLVHNVGTLLEMARARDTNQGVELYEWTLKRIEEASSQGEIEILADGLRDALAGIEAHGHFTNDEFDVVELIRAMG